MLCNVFNVILYGMYIICDVMVCILHVILYGMCIIDVCIDIYVMMSSNLYGTCRCSVTVSTGLCPVRSSADVIVTQITTMVFGNIATVTSQLLLCCTRCCIGHKWLMDQMCYKCEKQCFSHDLWKISELRNLRKFPNFGRFQEKIFWSEFVFFFHRFFF